MNVPADHLVPLPMLADVQRYVPCTWNLSEHADKRAYWLGSFRRHFPKLLTEALAAGDYLRLPAADVRQRAESCRDAFFELLEELDHAPHLWGPLDVLKICHARESLLREHGFDDPYLLAKLRANQAAMELLPDVLRELDGLGRADRVVRLMEGVFAGNIYDLGATDVLHLVASGRVDFHAVRAKLTPRPWLIDDLDAWMRRLAGGTAHRCVLMFVDNAGCDVVLGMIPLARDFLRRGSRVILTANTLPALNDITHTELVQLIQDIASWDPIVAEALASGQLELVASGNGYPLIDLRRVSSELAQLAQQRGVDLVILEGMGRAIESNLEAAFHCECLKLAMIKDASVAHALGGRVYDVVLRYHPARA